MPIKSTNTSTAGAASPTEKSSPTYGSDEDSNASAKKSVKGAANSNTDSEKQGDAEALLKADHRKVEKLFQEYKDAKGSKDKKKLSNQICMELIVHTELEEELFYPACRKQGVEDDKLDEAQVEHDGAKILITQLLTLPADSEFYDAKVKVLSEYIKHHVSEEENPKVGIFAKARSAGVDMTAVGKSLQSRKEELLAQGEDSILHPPIPRSYEIPEFLNRSFKENPAMANYQNRDEQGRFTNEGNRGSGGRYASHEQYDDRYDQSRHSGGHPGNRDRDEYGRFTSQDDHRNGGYYGRDQNDDYSRSSGSRSHRDYNDYDDNYSSNRQGRGQSHGGGQGWHGDPEGHSQAARRGQGNYNDDRSDYRYSGTQGNGGQGRGQGWYGDSEGHSQAAYRGHQQSSSYRGGYDDDRNDYRSSGNQGGRNGQGHGGWFGDPEGHSEAARSGHQSSTRSNRDYDDGRNDYRSSNHRNNQGGQGHGGWFGDSEGHSATARRGWDNR